MSVMARGAIVLSTLSLAACLAAADARAGDGPTPIGEDARCRAFGDGFLAAPGSDACVRFSGYVDAGAEVDSASRGALAPRSLQAPAAPVMRAGVGAALDARIGTPMGPARAYIEIRRPGFGP